MKHFTNHDSRIIYSLVTQPSAEIRASRAQDNVLSDHSVGLIFWLSLVTIMYILVI